MFDISPADGAHPTGESKILPAGVAEKVLQANRLAVDLPGRRVYVEWDPYAPVTPLGQLVYFSQFLATSGLFSEWVSECPLSYTTDLPDALSPPNRGSLLHAIDRAIAASS